MILEYRVAAKDEGMHVVTGDPQWNESMFFHVPEEHGRATLMRIGRRVNEGRAEVTVLHLMPDGGALIAFKRVPISGNAEMAAGGLRFTALEPLKRWSATFQGEAKHLLRGEDLADPRRSLSAAQNVQLGIAFEFEDIVPPHRASADGTYAPGAIADGHYKSACAVTGTITINGRTRKVSGFGLRDHSWGARVWSEINYWRWIWGHTDRHNLFFLTSLEAGTLANSQKRHVSGLVINNGQFELVNDGVIESHYGDQSPYYLERALVRIPTQRGELVAELTSRSRAPLQHRGEGEFFRIVEASADLEWNGHQGVGFIESADRIIDGIPYGNSHE